MTQEMRMCVKIASLLLQFPDERLVLDSVAEAVGVLAMDRPRQVFEQTLAAMRGIPLLDLQEEYTRVFDLNPATSLNLTYHRFGNEKKRGEALARLNAIYRAEGCEGSTGELPDYLPMVFEFLAVASERACSELLGRVGADIRGLASRLREVGTVYGPLLDGLADLLPDGEEGGSLRFVRTGEGCHD